MFSIRNAFNKAAVTYNQSAVLQREICARLAQHLDLIRLCDTKYIIDLGAGTGISTKYLRNYFSHSRIFALDIAEKMLGINKRQNKNTFGICADAHYLPFPDNSIDVIFSNLMLQWCIDTKVVFRECARVLINGGLFIFSSFGVDTLCELKKSWARVDHEKMHVNTFLDMHTIGDMLVGSGLTQPVMETEYIKLTYHKVSDLIHDLKAIGAHVITDGKIIKKQNTLTGKHKFQKMLNHYELFRHAGKLPATYEVIYGHAWNTKKSEGGIKLDNN